MLNPMHILIIAGAASATLAQPFAHHIGEPAQAREFSSDLTLLSGGEIASVGGASREIANLQINGYLVVHDANGFPLLSWLTDDPDSDRDEMLAAREDPADKNLIILQESQLGPNAPGETLLFKVDPFPGTLGYQWRYPITGLGQNLGMELDGETGLVAASATNTFGGTQATLLRYRNATGLPVYHFRYLPVDAPAFNMRFFDVAVHQDTGEVFAVGSVSLDAQGFSPEPELLIARFTPGGAPIWFNAYELRAPNADIAGPIEGVSIELDDESRVVVIARLLDPSVGPVSAHVIVDAAAGAPVALGGIVYPGGFIEPAYSSLERRADGSMLVSGTADNVAGARVPAVWTFDGASAAFDWAWMPDAQNGIGNSAIPQPGFGPIVSGQVTPNSGPFGGLPDLYLARTAPGGGGLCPTTPDLRDVDLNVQILTIPVQRVEMPNPQEAGIEIVPGEPRQDEVCRACPADLAPPFGVLNFFDLVEYIARYNAMDPSADLAAPFGAFNFFDIAAYIALYNAGCP